MPRGAHGIDEELSLLLQAGPVAVADEVFVNEPATHADGDGAGLEVLRCV